jgi:hypothetical protein
MYKRGPAKYFRHLNDFECLWSKVLCCRTNHRRYYAWISGIGVILVTLLHFGDISLRAASLWSLHFGYLQCRAISSLEFSAGYSQTETAGNAEMSRARVCCAGRDCSPGAFVSGLHGF